MCLHHCILTQCEFLLFWHAPLEVLCAIRRHQPPQRAVLSQSKCEQPFRRMIVATGQPSSLENCHWTGVNVVCLCGFVRRVCSGAQVCIFGTAADVQNHSHPRRWRNRYHQVRFFILHFKTSTEPTRISCRIINLLTCKIQGSCGSWKVLKLDIGAEKSWRSPAFFLIWSWEAKTPIK